MDERIKASAAQEMTSALESALISPEYPSESGKKIIFDLGELKKFAWLLDQPLSLVTSHSATCIVKNAAWSLLYAAHCISNESTTIKSKMMRVTFIFISICKCR